MLSEPKKSPPQEMEKSISLDATEDSGLGGSLIHSSTSVKSRSSFESTPMITTRKRKLYQPLTPSPIVNFASSTFNESGITRGLEICNISKLSPNFYVERWPEDHAASQCSPTKTQKLEESQFYKNHKELQQKTPTKNVIYSKLGSPERNQILYGELKLNSFTKLNFSNLDFKRSSPAKKQLFSTKAIASKVDPVEFLTRRFNNWEILEKILSYLGDLDLCRLRLVSRSWRRVVDGNKVFACRAALYLDKRIVNKENNVSGSPTCYASPVPSPLKYNQSAYYHYMKIGSTLKEGQRLDKCPRCCRLSIVERNIGQCQHYTCGYIYCLKCDSFSVTGPENFTDKCMQSCLLIEKKQHRRRITDSPEKPDHFSFLSSPDTPKQATSIRSPNLLSTTPILYSRPPSSTRRSSILCERNLMREVKPNTIRRHSYTPVIPLNSVPKTEIIEPSSPPKVKNIVCSASSRRNLKRLLR